MRSVIEAPIKVLIVDDYALVRTVLRLLLEYHPHLSVVHEAANCQQALDGAAHQQPDIICLDLDLGNENGLDIIPDLLRVAPEARIVVVTGAREPELLRRAIHQGAMGVVHKEQAPTVLVNAIERVYAGEEWFEYAPIARALGAL